MPRRSPIDLHQVFHARLTRRLSTLPEGADVPREWLEEVLEVLDRATPGEADAPGEGKGVRATSPRVPLVPVVGLAVGLVLVGVVALS